MDWPFSRRGLFQGAAVATGLAMASRGTAAPFDRLRQKNHPGWVIGHLTGAQAVAETLLAEGTGCVFGIPGAQENELWDELKARNVHYQLVTHEYSAACMADGYARATGTTGVLCVVPGPGVTNALTGLGEALLDSIPVVAIVGDVGNGEKARPFQVHSLNQVDLLKPVCKAVYSVCDVKQIPNAIRQAFQAATCGEPGPTAVVIPYNLLIEMADFRCPPLAEAGVPFDDAAFAQAVALLGDKRLRVGVYAGLGCMDFSGSLTAVAELLQAPVATSVSGKGAISDCHPLGVGWGYGPHASEVAEIAFAREKLHPHKSGIDVLLAVGVKFSEVSTGYYGNPRPKHVIHVDVNANNLGKAMPADVCVHADVGLFLGKLLTCGDTLRRPTDGHLLAKIRQAKADHEAKLKAIPAAKCGVDPLALVAALRRGLPEDAMLFTDVTASEHLAAESFRVTQPRTYFNPVDNQSMGWSIPAALGAQQAACGRTVAAMIGDGCFLMSAMELSTAAREGLPVKVFVLDDHAYHYMQMLQKAAYKRTTATELGRIDYRAFAQAVGVAYQEILVQDHLDAGIRSAVCHTGPVLVRVLTDYGDRKIRWIEAVRDRYAKELTPAQKARFASRIGYRTLSLKPEKSD
ncbi:thiamine pyrophosphate-binding protein [Limnoglobus roseus]|uniref:Thiamine pyrophosphate-binding protein n=1 Tax=Limnoglobus roseus TaxID=2598579 RepID=A0A5C1AJW6_9BACT|nr:thiamine pyrophosphate-binding protein [Limnoglobus roseus]QEL19689.1 thiamine pyrophosphate-binding protein [Limnoglobus roseus]